MSEVLNQLVSNNEVKMSEWQKEYQEKNAYLRNIEDALVKLNNDREVTRQRLLVLSGALQAAQMNKGIYAPEAVEAEVVAEEVK